MREVVEAANHGGDLTSAAARFGIVEKDWLDLSTGINPLPYPHTEFDAALLRRLPTRGDAALALGNARGYYGVPHAGAILAVPGTQAALQALPTLVEPGTAAILGPTYSEHAITWRAGGHRAVEVADLDGLAEADVAVLVNPNNPDGRRTGAEDILALTKARGDKWTIVDEAFADTDPDLSGAGETGTGGLLVLRSLGKFFGLAGLRAGFVIGTPKVITALEARLGPWAIGGGALTIAARALGDKEWIGKTRTRLKEDRAQLDALLEGAGMTILGGTDLFILAEHNDAVGIYERLGHAGILVRTFQDHPTWLRFGLPGHGGNVARLKTALN